MVAQSGAIVARVVPIGIIPLRDDANRVSRFCRDQDARLMENVVSSRSACAQNSLQTN